MSKNIISTRDTTQRLELEYIISDINKIFESIQAVRLV